jgi:hypothetical protein
LINLNMGRWKVMKKSRALRESSLFDFHDVQEKNHHPKSKQTNKKWKHKVMTRNRVKS